MSELKDRPVRQTRIVCISDTHNQKVKLPKGDVLIHAGDLTNQGSYSELSRAVAWLEEAPFERKFVIAGNHDITLDEVFYTRSGGRFHNQALQSVGDCIALLKASPSVTYLCQNSASVFLESTEGPRTRFTIFGSPYSPRSGGTRTRTWAFQYDRAGTETDGLPPAAAGPAPPNFGDAGTAQDISVWSAIPPAVDIVVTHTPPFGHCDWDPTDGRALGCESLRLALSQVRPRLAVCGHVHAARGVERVTWPAAFGEAGVKYWEDPGGGEGNKKQSIVDLTSRGGRQALDNDGVGEGRRETCIVNCAMTATSYPHVGGRKLNKPIVVDLELPVWEELD